MINTMRNRLSHTLCIQTIGFIPQGNAVFLDVLISVVDGDILLLPVRVRHVENALIWLSTLIYTRLWGMKFKTMTFVNVTCVLH